MKLVRPFSMILFFVLLTATVAAQDEVFGVIYQTANVRSGPDTRYEIVGQLSEGDRVQIDGKTADESWLRVILATGEIGWLPAFALIIEGDAANIPIIQDDDAEATPAVDTVVSVVSYGRVNVRSGPGISYEIVAQLDVADTAEAIARSSPGNDWLLIRFDETEGWVAYFTVNVQGDPRGLPVLVPDSSGEDLIPPSRVLQTRFNVRLHAEPQLESPVLLVVPFGSEVTAISRTADGRWLLVGYQDLTGWGMTQLFEIADEVVDDLPIFDEIEVTPEATAESSE